MAVSAPKASAPPRTQAGARARMLDSAVSLLRERSAAAVSIDAVLAHSGAPRGSVYHHFPGGRDQLLVEAVQIAGAYVADLIAQANEHESPGAVVRRFLTFWERILQRHDYLAGCPVVALTVDSHPDRSGAPQLVADIFRLWQSRLHEVLVKCGVPDFRAGRLVTLVIAAAEGAVLLCRAERSAEPLREVAAELSLLLDAAVERS